MPKKLFKEQPNGYDKKQVDRYIRKLMKSYEITYKNYLEAFEKNHTLKTLSERR